MAQLTFLQMIGEVGAWLDINVDSGSDGETTVKRCLNWGGRRIWTSRPWYERRGEVHLVTVAPYETGTVLATNGSPTLTGTGTTWTGFEKRKFGLALGDPWYRITTVGSATSITLADNYAEDTVSGSTYVIYQDEYDVASTADEIYQVSLFRQEYGGRMTGLSEAAADSGAWTYPTTGRPTHYALTNSTTAGTRRLRLLPIPDDEYRFRVRYWKAFTDMSADADLCVLGQNKELLLMKAACLEAQKYGASRRKVTTDLEVLAMIDETWKNQQDRVPITYQRKAFDDHGFDDGFWMDVTNAFS